MEPCTELNSVVCPVVAMVTHTLVVYPRYMSWRFLAVLTKVTTPSYIYRLPGKSTGCVQVCLICVILRYVLVVLRHLICMSILLFFLMFHRYLMKAFEKEKSGGKLSGITSYLHIPKRSKSSIGSDLNLQSLLDAINYKAAS